MLNVRVESKSPVIHSGMSYEEKESERFRVYKEMLTRFRKTCTDNGIMHSYRQHEKHESRGQKRRRKRHELQLQALKNKLKENFTKSQCGGKI